VRHQQPPSRQSPSQRPHGLPPQQCHRVRTTLLASAGVFALLMIVAVIAGSAGNGSQPSPSSPSSSTAPFIAQAVSSPCTSHHCITDDAEQGLPGAVAKDNSVVTKVGCHESTVKPDGHGDYTVDCTATYSDDATADGYATVELARNEVLFEPAGSDG
jgi:hypothetical protein